LRNPVRVALLLRGSVGSIRALPIGARGFRLAVGPCASRGRRMLPGRRVRARAVIQEIVMYTYRSDRGRATAGRFHSVGVLFVLASALLAACSSPPAPGDAGDAAALAAPDVLDAAVVPEAATDACASENGSLACSRAATAICDRVIQCCNAAGVGVCQPWGYDAGMCRSHLVSRGLDCGSTVRATSMVCTATTDACIAAAGQIACADILLGTFAPPTACSTL